MAILALAGYAVIVLLGGALLLVITGLFSFR